MKEIQQRELEENETSNSYFKHHVDEYDRIIRI